MTQKKSSNGAVCSDDWGWAVLSRDFMYHFHQKVHWEMLSLSAVSLCVAVCCAAPEVTDLPLCCVRASNLWKPHQEPVQRFHMSLPWLASFCINWKSTAGNFGQQCPLFPELIFALPFSVLQEVILFHVSKFVGKVWLLHLWPWAGTSWECPQC